jgi:hypothetical protein
MAWLLHCMPPKLHQSLTRNCRQRGARNSANVFKCVGAVQILFAGIDSRVDVLVSPDDSKAQAVQQQLGGSVTAALAARGGSKGMLERVVTEASSCLVAGGW